MKKPKTTLHLELDGKVSILEKRNKKIISRDEIDGKAVLNCVLYVLEQSLKLYTKNGRRK